MPNAQAVLAGFALTILGLLGGAMIIHAVPADNKELVSFITGAISGVLTTVGVSKAIGGKDGPTKPTEP